MSKQNSGFLSSPLLTLVTLAAGKGGRMLRRPDPPANRKVALKAARDRRYRQNQQRRDDQQRSDLDYAGPVAGLGDRGLRGLELV